MIIYATVRLMIPETKRAICELSAGAGRGIHTRVLAAGEGASSEQRAAAVADGDAGVAALEAGVGHGEGGEGRHLGADPVVVDEAGLALHGGERRAAKADAGAGWQMFIAPVINIMTGTITIIVIHHCLLQIYNHNGKSKLFFGVQIIIICEKEIYNNNDRRNRSATINDE